MLVLSERLDARVADLPAHARIGLPFGGVLAAAQAGAEWAWTQLYRSLGTALLAYLRGQGADDAEGLLGDVFLQLARNISTFDGDESAFRSWAFIVAHHRVLDERRRRRRRPQVPVARVPEVIGGNAEDDALGGMLDTEVMAALSSLTPEQRDVVLLRVFADLSLDEVSTVLNRPISAVKALQRRAYGRLRKKLSQPPYPEHDARR